MNADVEDLISTARKKTDGQIGEWSKESSSRQAQVAFNQQLGNHTESLAQALDETANALGDIRNLARNIEVRDVAVID